MDSFFTFLILLMVSAVGAWLKNRAARSDSQDTDSDQPANTPPLRPRVTSWEAELRRLLNEEKTPTIPRPRPSPPPMAMPQPPPRPAAPPMVTSRPAMGPAGPPVVIRPVIVPRYGSESTAAPTPIPVPAGIQVTSEQLAPLRESQQAYQRASQLDKSVSARIDTVSGQRVANTSVVRRSVAPEITEMVSFFKSARTARQAVVAAVVLGPPRSLDETPSISW